MIPEGGFCGSAPGAAAVCGDAYIASSVCAFANAYPPRSVHQIHATLSLRMSETYARHSESQHVQTQHGYGGPPIVGHRFAGEILNP
jgi:hypothetical protein